MKRPWRHRLPEAPVNVRLVDPDGTVHPVELAYAGRNQRGLHQWTATTVTPVDVRDGFELLADEIPPRSSITVRTLLT